MHVVPARPAVGGFVGLEARIRENNDESLRFFVCGRDRRVLLGYELGERGRWKGLGACDARSDCQQW